mgnify:FL=1|jgi:hypothetical protein
MSIKILRNYVAKKLYEKGGTIANRKSVDFSTAAMAERLTEFGIDPRLIKSESELIGALNIVKQMQDKAFDKQFGGILKGSKFDKRAEVFDLEGRKIPDPERNIMGGQAFETEEEIAKRITRDNKLAAENLRIKKAYDKAVKEGKFKGTEDDFRDKIDSMVDDIDSDFATGGRAGFKSGLGVLSLEDIGFLMEPSGKKIPSYMLEGFQKGPKLSEEQLKELLRKIKEKDFKKKDPIQLMADGGRIGFKMGRRAFLKALGAGIGGAAALKTGIVSLGGKTAGKEAVKQVVKTPSVAGKPEWFDSLVNKVIQEGDDVTKNFATKEREIVHVKKIDEDNTVRVTQDLDEGAITVEYESPDNVFGDTVQLKYKKPLPDEGDPRPSAEFQVAESGPVGRQTSPDDYDIEIDEVGGNNIKDLNSDVSKLKEYATGEKPTIREMIQNKKRKDKAAKISEDPDARMDDVIRRQGEMLDDQDFDQDFSSGGIARMLGE